MKGYEKISTFLKVNLLSLWALVKSIFTFLGLVMVPLFEFGIPILGFLFLISLPFALLGAIIDYFNHDFLQDASGILEMVLEFSYNTYLFASGIVEKYPKIGSVFFILILIFLIKYTSSHILVRKHSYRSFLGSIFSFSIMIGLLLSIIYYEDISMILEQWVHEITLFFTSTFPEFQIKLNIERVYLVYLLVIYIIIYINNRLLWILSIFSFELFLIFVFYNDILIWLASFPVEYIRILQGLLPFIIIAPYAFLVWIFRDNDKFRDYALKESEIEIKKKDIEIREKELKNKETELNLKHKEFDFKQRNK